MWKKILDHQFGKEAIGAAVGGTIGGIENDGSTAGGVIKGALLGAAGTYGARKGIDRWKRVKDTWGYEKFETADITSLSERMYEEGLKVKDKPGTWQEKFTEATENLYPDIEKMGEKVQDITERNMKRFEDISKNGDMVDRAMFLSGGTIEQMYDHTKHLITDPAIKTIQNLRQGNFKANSFDDYLATAITGYGAYEAYEIGGAAVRGEMGAVAGGLVGFAGLKAGFMGYKGLKSARKMGHSMGMTDSQMLTAVKDSTIQAGKNFHKAVQQHGGYVKAATEVGSGLFKYGKNQADWVRTGDLSNNVLYANNSL